MDFQTQVRARTDSLRRRSLGLAALANWLLTLLISQAMTR
jgi:hypothetical protein